MKKRQIVILSIFALIVLLIGWKLYSNYRQNAKKGKKQEQSERYARVIEVENKTLSIDINGFGRVNPAISINVAPEVSGVIVHGDIPLKQGAKFKKNQVLFRIDDRETQLSLKARKSSFLNLMAGALADIKIDFPDSYDKWLGFYNSIDVDRKLPELPDSGTSKEKTFLASRNVLSEYYNIKKDEIRLSKYTVRAPFNGFFSAVMVQEGAFAGVGMAVATLSKVSDLEVIVPIDKENIYLIEPGQDVSMKTRGSNLEWSGKVKRVGQQVNPNTQSVNVYVVPLENKGKMIPGMYFEVDIHARKVEDSFELPRKALDNENRVHAIRDSVVIVLPVTVVKKNKDSYLVTGLDNGELVISEQIPNITEGQRLIPVR